MWNQLFFCGLFYLCYVVMKKTKVLFYGKIALVLLNVYIISVFKVLPGILFKEAHFRNFSFATQCYKDLIHFYGMKWQIQNKHFLESANSGVLVLNHQSIVDLLAPMFLSQIYNRFIIMGKAELSRWKLLSWLIKKCGMVLVDRNDPKTAYGKLNSIADILQNEKAMLWVFPEGTRNKERKTKIMPFKKGAFVVAITAQIPVYPVVCSPHYFMDEKIGILNNDGKLKLRCLTPVPTKGLGIEDEPALRDRVYQMMLEAYDSLAQEICKELLTDRKLNYNV